MGLQRGLLLLLGIILEPTLLGAQESAEPALTEALLEPFRARLIGPANQSGRVTALAVPDSAGHRTIYAGFATGGVFKSANAGVTWQPIFDDEAFGSVAEVAVAPAAANVVWVGTGERNSLRSQGWGNGVYKSTDGGSSWTHMGLDDTREIGRIAIDPRDSQVVYVAALGHLWGANAERGVYKTTDGGESWEKVLFVNDTTGFIDVKLHPTNPDVVYAAGWHRLRWGGGRMEGAGAGSGIWKSTDAGRNWTRLTDPDRTNGLPSRSLGRVGLGVTAAAADVIYAVIQVAHSARTPTISPEGGLFRSDDAGDSWTRVNDLSAVPDYYYNEVWVDPSDADRLWLAGTLLGYSEDGGRTIRSQRLERVHVDHHAMWIDPDDPQHLVLGNDGGIYQSYDGGDTWLHHPLATGQFYEVSVDSTKTPYHVCGGLQDNGTWCGPSRTREELGITEHDWYTIFGGDGFVSHVSPDSAHIRYAESQFGNIYRLNTETWETTALQPHAEDAGPESGYAFRWDWNTPFVISHHDPTVLYLGGNFLFRLTERGDRWEILGPDMTRQNRERPEPVTSHTSYGALHSIAESPLDPQIIWTGSDDGLVWVTADGGRTWQNRSDRIPDEAARRCWVSEIEASVHDRATAFATFDCHMRDDYRPYVYHTDDFGESWTRLQSDLPEDAGSYVIREDPVDPNVLYLGNERGLYVSTNGGGSWARAKAGIPTAPVRDMNFAPGGTELAVGTYGRSIYLLDISAIRELTPATLARSAHLFEVRDARRFELRDTYAPFGDARFTAPNPPQTAVIGYYLRQDAGEDVQLTIRRLPESGDGDGDIAQTLTGSGRPGVHQVTWNLELREPRARELGAPTSPNELRQAQPGRYSVTLRVGDESLTETFGIEERWFPGSRGRVR
ncbi:MAG: VPS10 domain-containing protein [Longimicrobiales bacterium]